MIPFRCSTRVDSNGVHVGRIQAWGYCDMSNEACSGIPPISKLQIDPFEVGTVDFL